MTEAEQAVIAKLVEAWNEFVKLPNEHTDDTAEFRHTLHALQCQILARPTRRLLSAQPQPKAGSEPAETEKCEGQLCYYQGCQRFEGCELGREAST